MDCNQLLNSILKLAMQGNLIQHDKEDVEKVIEEIVQERKKLSLKKKLPYYDTQTEDNIPSHWRYLNLEFLTYHIGGKQNRVKKSEILNEGLYPVVSQSINQIEGYVNDSSKVLNIHDNSVIVFGDHSKTLKIIDFDFVIGADGTKIMVPIKINHKFLYYALKYNLINIKDRGYSRHFQFLKNKPIPFPPLKEQNNIVSRIEELIPKIERYGILYRDSSDINNGFPEKFKKSILQYALKGKLTNQKIQESAHVLYKEINDDINLKCLEGKYKKSKILNDINDINDNEIEFDIPVNWKWVRLGNLLYKLTDGTHSTPTYTENGVPFISVKDISSGKINFSNTRFISKHEHQTLYKRCNPEKNDILLTKVGTTGIPIIVDTEKQFSLFVSVALLKFNNSLISNEYLAYAINSPLVQSQVKENTRGVGNKNWVMRDIANTILPLPPYEEQQRIVNTLNQLFKIIDTK